MVTNCPIHAAKEARRSEKQLPKRQQEKNRDQVTIDQCLPGAEVKPQGQEQVGENAFHEVLRCRR